ncbi:MAG: peptidoglycan DD-metalloendopeptidase family protein [Gammaproteobacteria bacterium]
MLRAPSQIRYDYKPDAPRRAHTTRKLQWFAVGLGIPVLGLLLAMSTRNAVGTQQEQRAHDAIVKLPLAVPGGRSSDDAFHPPLLPDAAPAPASRVIPSAAPVVPEFDLLTLTVERGDTLDAMFKANGLDRTDLAAIMALDDAVKPLRLLRPGDEILVRHDVASVHSLDRRLDEMRTLHITRGEDGFGATIVEDEIERHLAQARGRIESSLFEAALKAGLSDRLIMNLAGIFAWDIDFVLDIRQGDEFAVVYEQIWRDGERQLDGEIAAAEFVNNGRTFRAVRYVDPTGRADYYTPEGLSVRKAFLRAPVDFSRISSNFNLKRLHPIFKTVRPHRGVDYAAPAGTPIRAAGDGKVILRGVNGGYGNAVILQHGGNITTLYGHMSRFASGVTVGTRVRQGQTIGFVGQTGYATGPHLHYEYRLNGVHRNPRTVKLPQADPISSEYKGAFLTAAEPLLTRLDRVKRTQLAAYE